MKVSYDGKNDVVTIYLDDKEQLSVKKEDGSGNISGNVLSSREYEADEAAGLILDMVDILGQNGNLEGFRVFNASRYYGIELLNCADAEELNQEELKKRPLEKVIKRIP